MTRHCRLTDSVSSTVLVVILAMNDVIQQCQSRVGSCTTRPLGRQ